ncbi:sensor histidine kinase [Sporomusa sp. KB1]|jgi:signal transduction histidine kinase|uniref:sensor histidine kinase n=1 Tax=Sporomusa sp. KB1 TaxID=943346 RepID=UPI00119E2F27|nr:ATP-binding protein [Sporomusa sp. KB1]TWH49325.1 sensor kinase SpoOB-type protein [Sporomusa sp. KB1]
MPELNAITLVLFSFPEAMVVAWLSLSMVGGRPSFRQILQMGCIQTLFAIFFLLVAKMVTLPFGVHTAVQLLAFPLQLAINILLVFLIYRYNIWIIEHCPPESRMIFFRLTGLLFTQTVIILHMGYQYHSVMQEHLREDIQLLFYIGTAVLPIITIIIVKELTEFMSREIELKAQLDTFRQVEELLYTMRIQRHDFTHELQVIYGLLEIQEFQEAREYIKKSVGEVAATAELIKTGNLGVTALLYTKTGLAEARKIDLQITVETSFQQFSQQTRDINFILGNLIDNALDAVNDQPVPERKVTVSIRQELAGYILEVKNPGPNIPSNVVDKIFAPGFSTKGEGRGMGLYSTQKLVHKYNGDIRVNSDCNGVCFKVIIPEGRKQLQGLIPKGSEL